MLYMAACFMQKLNDGCYLNIAIESGLSRNPPQGLCPVRKIAQDGNLGQPTRLFWLLNLSHQALPGRNRLTTLQTG